MYNVTLTYAELFEARISLTLTCKETWQKYREARELGIESSMKFHRDIYVKANHARRKLNKAFRE